jgi:hypothetical protein
MRLEGLDQLAVRWFKTCQGSNAPRFQGVSTSS